MAQMVKNLPAMQETRVQSLGQEDPLEKEMATHSSILAWRIPWTEKPGGLQSVGLWRVRHNWASNTNTQARKTKAFKGKLRSFTDIKYIKNISWLEFCFIPSLISIIVAEEVCHWSEIPTDINYKIENHSFESIIPSVLKSLNWILSILNSIMKKMAL